MVKKGRKGLIVALAALTAALVVFGCGGGGEESLTKAEYVRKGNAICGKWQQARGVLFNKISKEAKPPFTKAKKEKAISEILAPYGTATEALAELPVPDGEEAKVEAMVKAMEKAFAESQADPSSVIGNSKTFEKSNELVEAYGLKECKV